MTTSQTIRRLKSIVLLAGLVPAALLGERLITGNLGADPLAEITSETGLWALRFLAVTLAITPVRRLSGWDSLIRLRRIIGLFAFFYSLLHLAIFIVADRFASLGFPSPLRWLTVRDLTVSIGAEIYNRPYIAVGFTSWLIMFALALTSTTGMIRRLGGKRWRALHRLVYVAAIAGVVHYWWSVKADVRDPRTYAVVVATLLMFRVALWARKYKGHSPRSIARPAPNRVSTDPAARKPHAT